MHWSCSVRYLYKLAFKPDDLRGTSLIMPSQLKPALLLSVFGLLPLLAGCDASPPETNLAPAKAKAVQCVEPTADMRRNHMVYLDVHRDASLMDGIRTTKHSLVECIYCHVAATREDGSAVHYNDAQKDHFCATCHHYVGVKIDCFQCHADRPVVMKQPDYQHKLSSAAYHQSLKGDVTLADMMLVSERWDKP